MSSNENLSLISNCVVDVFNIFFDGENNRLYLNEDIPPEFVFMMDTFMKTEFEVVYLKVVEECPVCGLKLSKNGTDKFDLNKCRVIKRQKYVCSDKDCETHTRACLDKFVDKYCNYTKSLREFSLNMSMLDHISYEKKSELIEMIFGIKIRRQTVHYHEKTLSNEYLNNKEKEITKMLRKLKIEPSGVYHYDEQVLWVDGRIKLRMTMIDAENNMIIREIVVDGEDFDKHTIEKFLADSLNGLDLKAIVTDGYRAYPSIIESLGAIHQKCVFHKMQTLMKKVIKTLNKQNRKIKKNTEKIEVNELNIRKYEEKNSEKRGRISKTDNKRQKYSSRLKKLKKTNRSLRSEIRKSKSKIKEIQKYIDKISAMFKSKKKETAMKRFKKLKEKIKELPEEIASFLKKISKDIETTLNHIQNDNIPNTNNKLEGYYKITLPRYLKRKFRTEKGLEIRLRLSRIRWTERNVLKIK